MNSQKDLFIQEKHENQILPLNQKMIKDVTDTALWIAAYRAEESLRKNALFQDPYAQLLIGDNGIDIAKHTQGSRYTAWSVIIRTCIIDEMIQHLIKQNIDTVLNLGAGLDTRPYRLTLPKDLRWIEVDFDNIIDLKEDKMKSITPNCELQRVKLDLSLEDKRNHFLHKINNESKKVLILTEGVVPYLSNTEVASLAQELFKNRHFQFWITEYYSPEILNFLRTPKRLMQMKNAPFQFYPDDWFNFFKENGWSEMSTKYFGIESKRLGRTPPTPGKTSESATLTNEKDLSSIHSYLGYTQYTRSDL